MKLFTDLFSHLFFGGLAFIGAVILLFVVLGVLQVVGEFLISVFYPIYAVTLKPVLWAVSAFFGSRCPECGGFFKKKYVKSEILEEREALQTVNRLDHGILYPNKLFAANQGFEVTRQEQVSIVEQTIRRHLACNDPACGHQWHIDEYREFEGTLNQ